MAGSCIPPARRALVAVFCTSLWLGACGGQRVVDEPAPADAAGDGVETAGETADTPADCVPPQRVFDEDPMLEKTQKTVYRVVYHSSRWFDGLFGSSDVQCAGTVSRGYIGPGIRWDERDGLKGRFREQKIIWA